MKLHTSDEIDTIIQPTLKKELLLLFQSAPTKDNTQFFHIKNKNGKCQISHQLSNFHYTLTLNYSPPHEDLYVVIINLNGKLWMLTNNEYTSLLQ